jgi:hypothetical protein
VKRVPRLTQRYQRSADRLGVVSGSARGRAVGQTIASLANDETLPGPHDTKAVVPPTGVAFVRRVPGRNLWLWYTLTSETVALIALTADPPVPADG